MNQTDSEPVLSCTDALAWERKQLPDEAAEWAAMQRAGRAVAAAVAEDFREIGGLPAKARLLVLVGKGHNGGDALLAARAILDRFAEAAVDVVFALGEEGLRPLTSRSWQELAAAAGPSRVRRVALDHAILATGYDLCLDGVFGLQFRLPLDEPVAEVLAKVNTHPRIRLRAAVDLPSGMGEANAGTVFRADFTYATGIVKSPVVAPGNAGLVGRLRYLDLGFFPVAGSARPEWRSTTRVLRPAVLGALTGLRPAQSDKRSFGHLLVVGGSRHYPGAILMTVQAALRSGVGLLTACVPETLVPEYAARFPEAMWVGMPVSEKGGISFRAVEMIRSRLPKANALAIGPGMGDEAETLGMIGDVVRACAVPVLLDADALRPEVLAAAAGREVVCTPHDGEFRRIAGSVPAGAVVVRKGSPTRITQGADTWISPFGGPVLARGGSGDILAGMIGGLLAQAPADLRLAACRGVVWHGLAADLLARDRGQVAVQTTQLFEHLQPALQLARHET